MRFKAAKKELIVQPLWTSKSIRLRFCLGLFRNMQGCLPWQALPMGHPRVQGIVLKLLIWSCITPISRAHPLLAWASGQSPLSTRYLLGMRIGNSSGSFLRVLGTFQDQTVLALDALISYMRLLNLITGYKTRGMNLLDFIFKLIWSFWIYLAPHTSCQRELSVLSKSKGIEIIWKTILNQSKQQVIKMLCWIKELFA